MPMNMMDSAAALSMQKRDALKSIVRASSSKLFNCITEKAGVLLHHVPKAPSSKSIVGPFYCKNHFQSSLFKKEFQSFFSGNALLLSFAYFKVLQKLCHKVDVISGLF